MLLVIIAVFQLECTALPDLERQARELLARQRKWGNTPAKDRPKLPEPPAFVPPHQKFFGPSEPDQEKQTAETGQERGELPSEVTINWNYTVRVSTCKPSTSIVPTPLFNQSVSSVSQNVWDSYGNLGIPGPRQPRSKSVRVMLVVFTCFLVVWRGSWEAAGVGR
ncbi:MAG: hypothetical protein COB65_12370, partial [Thalassobium sp.]